MENFHREKIMKNNILKIRNKNNEIQKTYSLFYKLKNIQL